MAETRKYWAIIFKAVGVLFGAGLLAYLFTKIDTEKTFELISSIGGIAILVFFPYLLVSGFDSFGWKVTFPNPKRIISFPKLLIIRLATEAMLMSIPAGVAVAESMKPLLLKKFLQVPSSEGVASVAVKKMLLGVAQGMYLLLSFFLGYHWLIVASKGVIKIDGLQWVVLAAGIFMTVSFGMGTYAFVKGAVAKRLHNLLVLIPLTKLRNILLKQEEKFIEVDKQLEQFNRFGAAKLIKSTGSFLLGWLMESVDTFVILWVLGVDISFVQVLAFETILSLVRSLVFFIPSGLGVQDLGYVAFLSALGVPDSMTIAGAFIL
ncbi:MAG: flippase-like domain-containing protein [Chlorobiales bacterium]|nr:flippase-like domain-containing protein [Chlorobiales bacterium]